ncbi:MAG: PASTA domain-containing protein [Cyclobacteriaceae bacterium]|nr:MAG: PASTA domain-containing protein [Cyclobacteriaceae bacterium]
MSLKKLLFTIIFVSGILGLLSFTFFYRILPSLTNKDQLVTVPDVKGMSLEEAKNFLKSKDLDFNISDSAYALDLKPLTVLKQYPSPNEKVKINRKINLVLNSQNPPVVSLPALKGMSLDFALQQIKSLDLKINTIEYKPDIAHNTVIEVKVNDSVVAAGEKIKKGTFIDLIIGMQTDKFPIPDFTGMELEDAEILIFGLNLETSKIHPVQDDNKLLNSIQRQLPLPGDTVRHGDQIELWVYNLRR